jgi:hypothetical protein
MTATASSCHHRQSGHKSNQTTGVTLSIPCPLASMQAVQSNKVYLARDALLVSISIAARQITAIR